MSRNSQLDLVLVHPGTRMQVYQSLGSTLAAIEPPVWASLLATFVRKRGFSVQILDAEAENLIPEETAKRIEEMDPLLAVVVVYGHQPSASTQNMTVSGLICDTLKELNPRSQISTGGRTCRGASRTYAAGGIGGFRLHGRRTLYRSRPVASGKIHFTELFERAGNLLLERRRCNLYARRSACQGLRSRNAGTRMGSSANGEVSSAQLALLRRS